MILNDSEGTFRGYNYIAGGAASWH